MATADTILICPPWPCRTVLLLWLWLVVQLEKDPLAMQETPVLFLGRKDPLEKGQATHSSIPGLPWWLSW